jgi:hypothetical protein
MDYSWAKPMGYTKLTAKLMEILMVTGSAILTANRKPTG